MNDQDVKRISDKVISSPEMRDAPAAMRAKVGYGMAKTEAANDGLSKAAAEHMARQVEKHIAWIDFQNRPK